MRSLKQYWQQAFASIRKALRTHPQHTSRQEELERKISAVTSENQLLPAELSQVRTDSALAQSEEECKIAALEQYRENAEAVHDADRTKLAELEQQSLHTASGEKIPETESDTIISSQPKQSELNHTLGNLNPDELSPREALEWIYRLKRLQS